MTLVVNNDNNEEFRKYDELTYNELMQDVLKITPEVYVVQDDDYIRVIPDSYYPEINTKYRLRQCKYFCFTFIKDNKLLFYPPSSSLLATLMQNDEQNIRRIFGEDDKISTKAYNEITYIVDFLKYPDEETIKRRLHIIDPSRVEKVKFVGYGHNATVKGKMGDTYTCWGKQLVHTKNGLPQIHDALQYTSTNPLNLASHTKYEFNQVYFHSHTDELVKRAREDTKLANDFELLDDPDGKELEKVESIELFYGLRNPMQRSAEYRKNLRKIFFNFIYASKDIKFLFDDHKPHKSRNYTLFNCELDAALLSLKETYSQQVLKWKKKFTNPYLNKLREFQYQGLYRVIDIEEINAVHEHNPIKNRVTHLFDNKVHRTHHAIKKDDKLFLPTINGPEELTESYKEYLYDTGYSIDEVQITHDKNNNYAHLYNGINLEEMGNDCEIVHISKIWDIVKDVDFDNYSWVLNFPNGVKACLMKYQHGKWKF